MKRSAHPEGRGHREAVTESNMIAEFDEVETPVAGASDPVLSATTRFYAWGLDLSGTPQGAGGVGGLLLVQQTSANGDQAAITAHLAPSYDGNGNITAYLDIANSQPVDQYEYDAFGRTLGISRNLEFAGTATITPPHRFSTKYTDIETGLMEYGYREYDAEKGRWISRDPIGERGGVHLGLFLENNSINEWDVLGLVADLCLHGPGVSGNPGSNCNLLKDPGISVFTVVGHGLPGLALDQRLGPADVIDANLQTVGQNGVQALSGEQLGGIIAAHQQYVAGKTCKVKLYMCFGGAQAANVNESIAEGVKRVLSQGNPDVIVEAANNIVWMNNGQVTNIGDDDGTEPGSIPGVWVEY